MTESRTASTGPAASPPAGANPPASDDPSAILLTKGFVVVLVISAIAGVVVSLAAWCFLELIHQMQQELYHHLPSALGYHNGPPVWWPLPILAVSGLITALAITRLPGTGGHVPAEGLKVGGPPVKPSELAGIVLAGLASIGMGAVIGPEAPLIALGTGMAVWIVTRARRDAPAQLLLVVGSAGAFAALAFVFSSPIIAAVILLEATGLGRGQLPVILVPGLVGAAIGSLVSIGMGAFTGLSSSAYALGPLSLPAFARPTAAEFGWAIALALAIALVAHVIQSGGLWSHHIVTRRPLVLTILAGLLVAGLAIAFSQATGKGVDEALFSGQDALPGLVSGAGTWSLGALALLVCFKGAAYAISLGSFRGGPTFPAIFLGAAAGIMASHLAGFSLTPAVAVGIAAGTAAILRLPLSAIVVATLLTAKSGPGSQPLVIVGAAVAYLATLWLASRNVPPAPATTALPAASPAATQQPVVAPAQ